MTLSPTSLLILFRISALIGSLSPAGENDRQCDQQDGGDQEKPPEGEDGGVDPPQ